MKRSAATRRMSRALEAQISTSRERMTEINQQREVCRSGPRAGTPPIEGGRQVVDLRLLGEASTLKNQLAQIG